LNMSNLQTEDRTHIAVVSWADGDKTQVRVYTVDTKGGIRESAYDGTTWTFNKDPIAKAGRAFTCIAAVKLNDDIHVYYTDNADIQEVYRNRNEPLAGNWASGTLNNLKIKGTIGSALAAVTYEDTKCVVFFQTPRGLVRNARRDGSGVWKVQTQGGIGGVSGTLAAVSPDPYGSASIRLYYQKDDKSVSGIGIKDDDYIVDDTVITTNAAYCNLAAVSNEVYFLNPNGWLSEGSYYGGAWHLENHPDQVVPVFHSGLAVNLDESGLHRAYIQNEKGQIVEYRYARPFDVLKDPKDKTVIPTGSDE